MLALVLQIVGDGVLKPGIFYPVGRTGGDRHVAAGQFVFALGASLNPPQAFGDGIIYRLIITNFKVQGRVIFIAPPVAAIKAIVADKIDGASNVFAVSGNVFIQQFF